MGNDASSPELLRLKGALGVLFELREEFAQWVEEAQDASKHEALDNVLAHVENIEAEYRRRYREAGGS
jgi:hypothetical protein